jgi:uncharacterized UPF0160 family protein
MTWKPDLNILKPFFEGIKNLGGVNMVISNWDVDLVKASAFFENLHAKKEIRVVIHHGIFHADDVFSTALVKIYFADTDTIVHVTRGFKVPENFDGIVYDIGGGQYDHHQPDAPVRENGVPYAAFGLIWKELGPEILGEYWEQFDKEFVQPIDSVDNLGPDSPLPSQINHIIHDMNPFWDEKENGDYYFNKAVVFAEKILNRMFRKYFSKKAAAKEIEHFLEKMKFDLENGSQIHKHTLYIDYYVPFDSISENTDIKYVVYPSNRGGYNIQVNGDVKFSEAWRGLRNEELEKMTGVNNVTFCHKAGFLFCANSMEAVKRILDQLDN